MFLFYPAKIHFFILLASSKTDSFSPVIQSSTNWPCLWVSVSHSVSETNLDDTWSFSPGCPICFWSIAHALLPLSFKIGLNVLYIPWSIFIELFLRFFFFHSADTEPGSVVISTTIQTSILKRNQYITYKLWQSSMMTWRSLLGNSNISHAPHPDSCSASARKIWTMKFLLTHPGLEVCPAFSLKSLAVSLLIGCSSKQLLLITSEYEDVRF